MTPHPHLCEAPGDTENHAILAGAGSSGSLALVLLVFLLTTLNNHASPAAAVSSSCSLGASLIALLGVGETMVIVTRNVDLSVGSALGLSAFVVGDLFGHSTSRCGPAFVIAHRDRRQRSERSTAPSPPSPGCRAWSSRWRCCTSSGAWTPSWSNGNIVVPSQVPHAFIDGRLRDGVRHPVAGDHRRRGRRLVGYAMRTFRPARELYAIGSNPEAAALAGIPSGRRVFVGVRHQRRARGPGRRTLPRPVRAGRQQRRARLRAQRGRRRRGRRGRDLRRQRHAWSARRSARCCSIPSSRALVAVRSSVLLGRGHRGRAAARGNLNRPAARVAGGAQPALCRGGPP